MVKFPIAPKGYTAYACVFVIHPLETWRRPCSAAVWRLAWELQVPGPLSVLLPRWARVHVEAKTFDSRCRWPSWDLLHPDSYSHPKSWRFKFDISTTPLSSCCFGYHANANRVLAAAAGGTSLAKFKLSPRGTRTSGPQSCVRIVKLSCAPWPVLLCGGSHGCCCCCCFKVIRINQLLL